jgi:hypothetical protein
MFKLLNYLIHICFVLYLLGIPIWLCSLYLFLRVSVPVYLLMYCVSGSTSYLLFFSAAFLSCQPSSNKTENTATLCSALCQLMFLVYAVYDFFLSNRKLLTAETQVCSRPL